MLKFFLVILLFGWVLPVKAQTRDSLVATNDSGTVRPPIQKPARRAVTSVASRSKDTLSVVDSLFPPFKMDTIVLAQTQTWKEEQNRYMQHPYYRFTNASRRAISIRQWQGKESVFYTLVGLLLFFAVIRNGFRRYIADLVKSFFRTSVRQRQLKEQLLQSPLPSLLLNVFFVFSLGFFAALALQHFNLGQQFNFWLLYLYCVVALLGIYLFKFVLLKFIGWAAGASDAADTYIFVIFSTNKILGIALLPVLMVLGFNAGTVGRVAITFGIVVIIGLIAYRFFLTYTSIHKQLQISFFHFLLYLAAFEVMPLLLINKLLFRFLS